MSSPSADTMEDIFLDLPEREASVDELTDTEPTEEDRQTLQVVDHDSDEEDEMPALEPIDTNNSGLAATDHLSDEEFFAIDPLDSSEVAYSKTEAKVDSLFDRYGVEPSALIPHLDRPSSDIPLASQPFSHTLRKVAGTGDTALRICLDGPQKYVLIGELAHHERFDLNKVGPYLDMLYQQNGHETLTLDAMKRGKARIVVRSMEVHADMSDEGKALIRKANERFNRLAAFLSILHSKYVESQRDRDAALYPKGVTGSSWLYQGADFYGMTLATVPIFNNVQSGRSVATPIPRLQGDYLAPVNHMHDENRRRNRAALEVTPENMYNLSLLANWPDPDGHIRSLGDNVYLGDVRVTEPDVFDCQGARIHPSEYANYLLPGTRVAVQVEHKLWDITSQRNGGPVANPSRHCVTVAHQIHIIPKMDEDVRDSIHRFEANNRIEAAQRKEQEQLAEEHRQAAKVEEVARGKAAEAREQSVAAKKKDREERLKSMWQAMASASSSSTPGTPTSSPIASSSSTPASESKKRASAEDPPATPSPSKRQATARMSTGGKPPKKVAATTPTSGGRSTRSKGKAKAVDAMEVDS